MIVEVTDRMSDAQPLTVEDLECFLNIFRIIMDDKFDKFYNLRLYRNKPSDKIPAAHQIEALERLHEWFREQRDMHSGSILVLPSGAARLSLMYGFSVPVHFPKATKFCG